MSKQLITTITGEGVNWRVEDRGIVLGRGKASDHKEVRDTVNKRYGGYTSEDVRLSTKLYEELKSTYKETGEAPKGFLDGNYTLEDE
ncbi:hypothetical protein [Bacillus cereus]|uniref:hypothetical protein n=1 Tax=Bacillus cereus TaxID=1396 RepID=UPI00187AF6DC|nr:hypothetical protein [Bacillus cereus]MBE7099933.1 hypothetical protein [Bacillus cereus]MBE7106957.1 hypothetical protein [Bacillus cereus]MBE7123973.1 hypothetical protein [Bacillus cereus]